MYMALFCAGSQACLTADAVFRMRNRHYLVAHVIAILIFTFKRFLYKLKHFPAAYLVASSAADAFFNIN